MLDKLRRHREGAAAKILLIALAGSFVIGFGVLPSLTNDPAVGGTIVAKVDGKPIYRTELDNLVQNLTERYREQFGAQLDDKMLEQMQLDQVALNTLINRAVLINEAGKAGLRVTDDDLREYILKVDAFRNENGDFDPAIYDRAIRGAGRGLTTAKFEAETRDTLLIQRLQGMINLSIVLTQDQLLEIYVAEREKANLAFVAVGPEDVATDVKVAADDLAAYYEAHKAEYNLPERRKFKYLELTPATLALKQQVTEEEARAEYEKRRDDFKQDEQVTASHILYKVEGDDAAWEAARVKAEAAAKKARDGADFAALAKAESQDSTAANGGSLGSFGRGQMVKAFEDKVFSMKAGEISDPVRTQYGWHVIKVTALTPAGAKPFEEVRPQVERGLKVRKGEAELKDVVAKIEAALGAGKDIDAVAGELSLPVQTTELLAKDGRFPGMIDPKPVMEAGFALAQGATSKLVEGGFGKYLLQVEAIEAARPQPLAEVKDAVEQALKLERAEGLAAARAAEILDRAKKSGSLKKAAGKLDVQETGEFAQIEGKVPNIGEDPELFRTVYQLRPKTPFPDRTFNIGGKYYVIQLIDRKNADLSKFEEEKEHVAEEQIKQKRDALFSQWLQTARGRTKIDILMAQPEPAAQPGFPTGG